MMDLAESVVGGLETVFGKSKPKKAETTSSAMLRPSTPSTQPALPTGAGPAFQIVEALDDGKIVFVVTNGIDRAVCNNAELAKRVRNALR